MDECTHALTVESADGCLLACECGDKKERLCGLCRRPNGEEKNVCVACETVFFCDQCFVTVPRCAAKPPRPLCLSCAELVKTVPFLWSLDAMIYVKDEDGRFALQQLRSPATFASFDALADRAPLILERLLAAYPWGKAFFNSIEWPVGRPAFVGITTQFATPWIGCDGSQVRGEIFFVPRFPATVTPFIDP